ncbi:MAG: YdiU family protein [Verrucomicrobia bacterium]|nr:YdiU family protein [Verrucomicrobiota bacterium]
MPPVPKPSGEQGGWCWDHSYARLPEALHATVRPGRVPMPQWVVFNRNLADGLRLDAAWLAQAGNADLFSGNRLPDGAQPLAQAYAGHQYGRFTILGDGRAILLGEHRTPDGERWDIQLKGAGRTPFSRGGDGRAALAPMLREFLISEAMQALGIPTTRSLAVVSTGEPVFRETPRPGAVLTRVAASHIRVGTFEWAAARRDREALEALAIHTSARHFPATRAARNPHAALLAAIVERQASLIARWQWVGFVHGVMNTDNMAVSGETLDYGPCAFLDACDPAAVFSSIDAHGRYAYGRQPDIALWNLTRLAESLLPLLHAHPASAVAVAQEVLGEFPAHFHRHWMDMARAKLGLRGPEAGDEDLVRDLLDWMTRTGADFTNTFRELGDAMEDPGSISNDAGFRHWHCSWKARLHSQGKSLEAVRAAMQRCNPAVIPRNHQVEAVLDAAVEGDMSPFDQLLTVLQTPFELRSEDAKFADPPPPGTPPCRTLCGT